MHPLDHLVYAVPDLPAALDWFAEHAGLRPAIGGRHLDQGTHNALVNLGQGAYLEIVAIDPENTTISPPRWMGVDHISEPRMVRWSLKSDNLEADTERLRLLNPALGTIHTGQRELTTGATLKWRMSLPQPSPAVELLPFFLDWSASDFHPTDHMPEQFTTTQIEIRHPNPEQITEKLQQLDLNVKATHGPVPMIVAHVRTPKGTLILR